MKLSLSHLGMRLGIIIAALLTLLLSLLALINLVNSSSIPPD
jgi:hypothetical protein